jgi:hypothetical protein
LAKVPSTRRVPTAVSGPRKMPSATSTSAFTTTVPLKDVKPLKPNSVLVPESLLSIAQSTTVAAKTESTSLFDEYDFSRPPAWANKPGEWSPGAYIAQQQSPRYSIHEPAGPPWYINHHLRPPPTAQPRTSFPPSAFGSSSQTGSQGSSRSTAKAARPPRTYTDTVDSLDVTDPHGTRWHHASPYELGRATSTLRPRTQFLGPGVGTFAGAIEGSEPIEVVR